MKQKPRYRTVFSIWAVRSVRAGRAQYRYRIQATNDAGRRREASMLRSSRKLEVLGGSETRPTCKHRMKNVLKKRVAGEVVSSQRRARKVAVMARRGHRESVGH